MDREKRKGNTLIPDNLEEMLSEAQRQALPGIKYLGWEPRFLRKQLFQVPVLVMYNSNDGRIGLMDEDGRIRIQANIKVREQESQTRTPPPSNLFYY
jgi:hypothetical protein